MSVKFMIKPLNKKLLSGIFALVFLLTMSLSVTALSREDQPNKQNVLRQTSLKFIEAGKQQYQRDLFADAERSFRRARIFQNFLTAAEREQLNELLANARIAISEGKQTLTETKSTDEPFEPNQPVRAEVIVEKVKEEPALITEGREQTEERLKMEVELQAKAYAALKEQLKAETQLRLKAEQEAEAQTKQRAIIEAEYAEALSAAQTRATEKAEWHAGAIKELEQKLESLTEKLAEAEAKAESYAATIKQLEEKLNVQAEEAAKAEAQLQAQAQAYTVLEEQLKAETQARFKAQQESQTQAQAKIEAEATSEAVAIDQATQNKIDESIRLLRDEEPAMRNSDIEELEQMDISAVPSLIGPNTPEEKTIDMGNGITMEFVLIPAGEFDMGSPVTETDRENDEYPVHRIQISRPFYMGKYEVTQEQYYVVAKYKPSRFKQEGRPVENVSWDQAVRFCRKLSEMKEGTYRLPTEAEWEYACRAGSQDRFYFGFDPEYSQIEKYTWYSENSDSATHPVGEKKPNSFGLYDMHGNVSEWCWDWYAADSYSNSKRVDPPGPQHGKSRVLRGGSWHHKARDCRSASRDDCEPVYIQNYVGFRVVLEAE
jgi:formylglycine-generating enzyme required for sulfatase activity